MEGDSSGLRERNEAAFAVKVGGRGFTRCTFTTVPVSRPPEREKRLFLVELSLHGAAGYKERQGCLWTGGSTARGCMIGGGGEEAASWGLRPHMAA